MLSKITAFKSANRPYTRWQSLPLGSVTLTAGFWAERQKVNRHVSLHHGYRMLEEVGSFDNFRIASGSAQGEFRGRLFTDSDVYKFNSILCLGQSRHNCNGGLGT